MKCLTNVLNQNPPHLFEKLYERIKLGNFDDDIENQKC